MKLPRIRLPRWLKILFALGAVFVVGVVLPLAIWILVDIAPQDDSDLAVEWREVAPEDNGFELVNFDEATRETISTYSDDASEIEEQWEVNRAREIVEDMQPYLGKLEQCLALPEFSMPKTLALTVELGHILSWRHLTNALRFRARLALDDGRATDAIEDAFRLMEFGRRITRCGCPLFPCLFGAAIVQFGYAVLRDSVSRTQLGVPELVALRQRLERYAPARDDLERTLKFEYAFMRQDLGETEMAAIEGLLPDIAPASELICVNETRHLSAELVRFTIRNLDVAASARAARSPTVETVNFLGIQLPTTLRNLPGRLITEISAQSLSLSLARFDSYRLAYSATLALVAVRAYHVRHGEIPETLEALVPEFLDAMPIDPYDGEPLRYSKAKQRIWSVGGDGVNTGGLEIPDSERDKLDEESEPTLTIRFGGK